MDERSAVITIAGEQYELILTTKATKAIAGRYGGLENLGERVCSRPRTSSWRWMK